MFEEKFPIFEFVSHLFMGALEKYIPKVFHHFRERDFNSHMWLFQWMESLFLYSFPFRIVVRIWDYIFTKGILGCIDVGLAVLYKYRHLLLQMDIAQLALFFNEKMKNIIPFKYQGKPTEKKKARTLSQLFPATQNSAEQGDEAYSLYLEADALIQLARKMRIPTKEIYHMAQQFLSKNQHLINNECVRTLYEGISAPFEAPKKEHQPQQISDFTKC